MTTTALDAGARLLDAIGAQDFAAMEACFAPAARLRAMVPSAVREDEGPAAIGARFDVNPLGERPLHGSKVRTAVFEVVEEDSGTGTLSGIK